MPPFSPSAQRALLTAVIVAGSCLPDSWGGEWTRFRGPNGVGVSPDARPVPTEWSDTRNLKWKTQLPGPGHSSPIVVGERVFVTCWSGYGVSRENPGNMEDLRRHILCIDRNTGSIRWSREVKPVLPEEEYRGMFAQNGYASHTPASDGERVYVFFGKTGVYAFDLEGNELWHKSVGTGDDRRGWGSAASPILYKDLVIVPAVTESRALVALHKLTGEEVWRQEAEGFNSTWGTPVLVDLPDGRTDLVIAVPYEIWGLNPDNGKLRWYSEAVNSDSICSSLVAHGETVYLMEGMNGGAVAVRAGGNGDVARTHVLWSNRHRNRISTPLYYEGRLYWISGGIAHVADAATGEELGTPLRLQRSGGELAEPPRGPGEGDRPGGDRPEGGFRGGPPGGFGGRGGFPGGFPGGRMGGQDYSSPVLADGKIYFLTRSGDGIVLRVGPTLEQIAANRFESDASEFTATPAICDGEIFIRSNRFLYCVAQTD